MNLAQEPARTYTKQQQTHSRRIKPTQRQMGAISQTVRQEVRARSGGICEVRQRCNGAKAVQQAHIIGRKQLTQRTTAATLLDSCLECHKWMDETTDGIRHKRRLRDELLGNRGK